MAERPPSNKAGENSKCFAERRLQVLSPEISPPVVTKLYRIPRCLGREQFWRSSASFNLRHPDPRGLPPCDRKTKSVPFSTVALFPSI
jgi:hypothetical protein